MYLVRSFLAISVAIFLFSGLQAQSYLKVIGVPGRAESGFVAHRAPNGELYIGGSVNDSALVKRIDADGNVLWSRSFKTPGQYVKNVLHLSTAPDGTLLGCGSGYGPSGEEIEGFHFRMDNNGNLVWARSWDDPQIYERRILAVDANEYMVFGGYYDAVGPTFSDVLTARLDAATGDIIWLSNRLDQYAPVPYISDMGSAARIGDSFYAATSIFTNGSPLSTRRVGLSKFDITGQHVNTSYFLFPNTDDRRMVASDIIATNDSLTLSYFGDTNGSSLNFTLGLIRMDTLGNVAWARDYNVGGSGREQSTKVIATSFGYVIAGRTMTTTPNRLFLMAISNTGGLLWTKSYGPPTQAQTLVDLMASNLVDLGDGFLLTGTVDQGGGDLDILLIRTDINGDIICSDVNPLGALTTILPQLSFPSPVQETPFFAALGDVPTVAVDALINDLCQLTVDLGNDTSLCGTLQLDAGVANAIYEWQDGSTDQTLDVTASGTYWVRVTQDCCLATDTIEVQIGEFADLDLGPDTAICAADLLILEPPFFPGDYLWSDGSTDMIFLVFEPGTYWLEITDGGCVARDTIIVSTLEVPTIDLGADTSSCTGTAINLVPLITGADELLWSDGSDGTELLALVSGTYWLEAGNYCAFVTDTIVVTIADPIVVDLGPDTVVCSGTNYLLVVDQPGWSVTWSDGSTGTQLSVSTSGTYWVDVVNGQCAYSDTVVVDELDVPTILMPSDTVVCDGGPFAIVPVLTDPDVLLWSDGSTDPELIVTASGLYSLSVSNACGSATAAIDVTVVSLTTDLGADTLLCVPDSLVLDLSDVSGTLLWSDGSSASVFTITAPGTYWVEANVQTCIYRDTLVVDYTQLPELDLGPDTVLCEVPAFILDAGEDGDAAVWSDGSTGRYLFVSEAAVYSARIDNYCGRVADTVRVAFSMPVSSLTDVSLCPGKKAELHPVGELLSILWSTGDTLTAIEVGEGEYSYDAIDIVGCPHTDDVRVFIDSGSDGQVYIPNAFSPNGDGFNEFFTVSGPERGDFSMVIFDRWGEELYRTDNPYKGWDGSTASGPAMNDVHVYVVTYKDRCTSGNTLVTRRGHVTLLR